MRRTLTLFTILCLCTLVQAQITIERQDFTLEVGAQTKAWRVDFTNASAPEIGEGMIWDYSELMLGNSFLVDYEAPSSPLFPEANITEPIFSTLLGGLGVQSGLAYTLLDDTGYGSFGLIGEAVDLPLALLTGGATDTLKALELVIQYEERRSNIQFPLNYGDTWSYADTYDVDFLISVAAFGLQNVPAQQIIYDSSSYEVAGYGTIVLPNPEGPMLEPISIEALMIKRDRVTIDSFTLGGQPAPQVMLDAFGLEQSDTQVTTRYFIYAKGLPRTAANIELNSSGEVISFTISDDIVQLINSTSEAAAEPVRAKAFPNPAAAGTSLSVELPVAIDNGTLALVDIQGRQVAAWPMRGLQGQIMQYNLPGNLQAGLYTYQIRDEKSRIRGIGKLNIVR
jgi:hypothetical protein